VLVPFRLPAFYTAGMSEDTRPGEDEAAVVMGSRLDDPQLVFGAQHEELPALPRHLSALIGSLRGPEDLGRNHDKYLTYADREEGGLPPARRPAASRCAGLAAEFCAAIWLSC
jgi:hypothetical protein